MNVRNRYTVIDENLLRIYGFTVVDAGEMCGTFYTVNLFADFLENNLDREINARRS